MGAYNNKFSGMFAQLFQSVQQLLLDQYSDSIGAWSVSRKLRTAYTGSAIKVREDGGGTVLDIGFDGNGNLDEAALLLHCGVNSGFIHTIYDQGTTSNDGVQLVAANQPRIALNGVIDKDNGKPAMHFDGVNDYLDCGTINGGTKPNDFSLFSVLQTRTVTGNNYAMGSAPSSGATYTEYLSIRRNTSVFESTFTNGVNTYVRSGLGGVSINTQYIHDQSFTSGNASVDIKLNGSGTSSIVSSAGSSTTNEGTESNFSIGRLGDKNEKYWSGFISEITTFNVDNVTNRTGIRDNINTQFNTFI